MFRVSISSSAIAVLCTIVMVLGLGLPQSRAWGQRESDLRPMPPLLRTVSDEIGVLSNDEGLTLAKKLADIRAVTGAKVIILIAETTQPESIEAYVQRLVLHWGNQEFKLADGRYVFVVLARRDHALRIVAGEHYKDTITQLSARGLVAGALSHLQAGRYYEALDIVIKQLADLLGGIVI